MQLQSLAIKMFYIKIDGWQIDQSTEIHDDYATIYDSLSYSNN